MTDFINGKKKKNTVKSTNRDVNNFQRWLQDNKCETRAMSTMSASELNEYLAMYFISVRRKDGTEYEPSSLTSMMYSLDR